MFGSAERAQVQRGLSGLVARYSTNIAWQLVNINHMTILTKVGASCVDHMNDDAPEVDSFSHECYQALSSPHF